MGFLFFLLLIFIGYIIIRYRETTFPLLKKAFGDIQSDVETFKSKTANQTAEVALPYVQKDNFFTASELEFFRILNGHIDAHRYTVFPKVRIGDFVSVEAGTKAHRGAWNRIKAKHVDYIVWDLVENKIVLALELDGHSHDSDSAKKSDQFKNELHQKIGLELIRVKVGASFEEESRKIAEKLH